LSEFDTERLIAAIARISSIEHGPTTEQRVAEILATTACQVTGFGRALVLTSGTEHRPAVAFNLGVDEQYARFALEHWSDLPGIQNPDEPRAIPDITAAADIGPFLDRTGAARIRALAVFPMRALDDELVGALAIYDGDPTPIVPDCLAGVQALVSHASLALANDRLLRAREYLLQQTMLEKSQEVVSSLAAGIAHDFNNLLGGVLGMVTLAPSLSRPELKRLCEQLESSVDTASKHSRNLLELARTRQPQDDVENTELVGAIRDAVGLVQLNVHGDCRFNLQVEEGRLVARISPMAFSRVILNLLLNAVQTLGWVGGGRITIRLSRDDGFCVLDVDDDGPGLLLGRDHEGIDPLTTTGQGDDGSVGLAAARGIVERAGGTFSLEHREGPGACFRVRLPIAPVTSSDPELTLTPDPDSAQTTSASHAGVRLLLAEDEPVQRVAFAQALRSVGYEVDEVADGAAAREAAQHNAYSVLLLDHAMPHVTGARLLTDLRAGGSELPVVLVSGFGRDPQLTALADDPFTRVVSKPVKISTLLRIIDDLVT